MVYFDIFSNCMFMGSNSCSMSIPTFKVPGSRYHITGCVEVAPEAVLQKRFLSLKPALEAVDAATIICGCHCQGMLGVPAAETPIICPTGPRLTAWTSSETA